jgi:hypothetical protein
MSFEPPTAAFAGQTEASSSSQAPRLPEFGSRAGTGYSPNFGSGIGGGSSHGSKVDCQEQQCAEEECDPEDFGDENRAPRNDNYICGVDKRPLLPFMIIVTTMLGGLCMMMEQRPLLRQFAGSTPLLTMTLMVSALYAATLATLAYCALSDPGQLRWQDHARIRGDRKQEMALPKRAHKAWLYALPIRRYDHYCRWLTNVIGLLNHREFIIMCGGLVSIAIVGIVVDIVLLLAAASRAHGSDIIVLILHLMYSIILGGLAGPIFRLHVGFVSRNELANDWKKNTFYAIESKRTQKVVPVNQLSDAEFNERFDSFCYDETRNPWDDGIAANCYSFWFTSRWKADQLGDF